MDREDFGTAAPVWHDPECVSGTCAVSKLTAMHLHVCFDAVLILSTAAINPEPVTAITKGQDKEYPCFNYYLLVIKVRLLSFEIKFPES